MISRLLKQKKIVQRVCFYRMQRKVSRMTDIDTIKTGIFEMLQRDTWKDIDPDRGRFQPILNDALELLKEQQTEIARLKTLVEKKNRKIKKLIDNNYLNKGR